MSEERTDYDADIPQRPYRIQEEGVLPELSPIGDSLLLPIVAPDIVPSEVSSPIPVGTLAYYGGLMLGRKQSVMSVQPVLICTLSDAAAREEAMMTALKIYPISDGWERREAYIVRGATATDDQPSLIIWQETPAPVDGAA